ncbi:GntR family transcriptional regulator [Novosphingobium aquimarinum]|uniref:GntR family transcriptional regulator n=1 Tax=Novosphingobium aquimarinum TaxID=2682494 RepID=UPI0012EB1E37|nr:GntR family transcriptional regulator [Novosphingobium aquimarinum]
MNENAAPTLVESVYRRLREDIIRGVLIADSKLRISELRERYDVGGSPLREALNRLVSEGLVISIGQRGFHVPPISLDELRDLTETRILIETEALRRSILAGSDDWEDGVVVAFHSLGRIERRGDIDSEDRERRNRAFHQALMSACPLKKLLQVHEELYDLHGRYRAIAIGLDMNRRNLFDEHEAIYNAALGRDADTACEAARQHILLTAQVVEQRMADMAAQREQRKGAGKLSRA